MVGSGAAGIAAACAAARAGAKTLLVERYGFLGGTLAAVTLGALCGTHAIVDDRRLARVIGGLYLEVEARLSRRNGILPPKRHGKILGIPYDPEMVKVVADEMVVAYGVVVMHHTFAVDAQTDGARVAAVIVENKGGRGAIIPQIVVDASGDGDVAARAGAEFSIGAASEIQYGSAMFRLCNVDVSRAGALSREDIRNRLEKALHDGYPLPRTATGVHLNPIDGIVHLNVTRIGNREGKPLNLVDPEQLSEAEREGRRQVMLYEEVFRKYIPGFERARVIDIGANIGVRESRLIRGEKTLTEADVRGCVKPADTVACSCWALEYHGADRSTKWEFLPDGEWYGIPYGCLVVRKFDNLLVAGRNLSATHIAQASARIAGSCFAMGEAAGLAATMALRTKRALWMLPVSELRAGLRLQGAILEPEISAPETQEPLQ